MTDIESRTMKKVRWRILPLMTFGLFCSFLDKVNIGFAALTMNEVLNISKTEFGLAAGAFAIGYAIFGVPSTLFLYKLGARRWIALIALVWGFLSAMTAFVGNGEQLILVRFLLGIAEAGYNPGVIFFFGLWFPSAYRGRVMGAFLFVMPVGLIIGGPLSSVLLSLHGLFGLDGWQLLFLIEAIPTVLLAVLIYTTLTDNPGKATWLSSEERAWLIGMLKSEEKTIATPPGSHTIQNLMQNSRLWALLTVNLAVGTCGIGTIIFLPLVIQSMGFSAVNSGYISATPSIIAAVLLPLWGAWTDRAKYREHVVAVACFIISIGLAGTAIMLPSPWALAPLSLALIGFYGSIVAFWTLPSAFLIGAQAAAGIALINVAGNLGNFTGPVLLGMTTDVTGGYSLGLLMLACLAGISSIGLIAMPSVGVHRPAFRTRQ